VDIFELVPHRLLKSVEVRREEDWMIVGKDGDSDVGERAFLEKARSPQVLSQGFTAVDADLFHNRVDEGRVISVPGFASVPNDRFHRIGDVLQK
jgi:hypothetical protein